MSHCLRLQLRLLTQRSFPRIRIHNRYLNNSLPSRINPLIPITPIELLPIVEEERNEASGEQTEKKGDKTKNTSENTAKHQNGVGIGLKDNKSANGNGGSGNSNNPDNNEDDDPNRRNDKKNSKRRWDELVSLLKRCTETALITFASLAVLVLGGIVYHKMYKLNVLWKMEDSFHSNKSLLLVKHKDNVASVDKELWAERKAQQLIDQIVTGQVKGKYYLLLGEKGTGKTSTVLESINRVDGEDCAVIDCSSDIELMRLRIGNALNFDFFEEYIGSLFSMKGPREATPILDIERAFMKLERILIERRNRTKKPLILVFNNSHLVDSSLVELLQQKAENFSSSGMMTMLFISDDYWLFEKLKTLATRMQVINFEDTKLIEATKILKSSRLKYFKETLTDDECAKIYSIIGGRPQHLNHVASQKNMIAASHELIDSEKLWFLNNCALLGADMDDDVMESGKFSTSAMLLMREFVERDRIRRSTTKCDDLIDVEHLPQLPLWRARQVMTRPDYIEKYDKLNIFTIGTDSNVKADSVPMMRAFHEIASRPGFDDLLRETIDRVSEIESLGRTRELVFKNLEAGGRFNILKENGSDLYTVTLDKAESAEESKPSILSKSVEYRPGESDLDYHEGERKKWWKRRLGGYTHFDSNGHFDSNLQLHEKTCDEEHPSNDDVVQEKLPPPSQQ